jgi:hypothetical protein
MAGPSDVAGEELFNLKREIKDRNKALVALLRNHATRKRFFFFRAKDQYLLDLADIVEKANEVL